MSWRSVLFGHLELLYVHRATFGFVLRAENCWEVVWELRKGTEGVGMLLASCVLWWALLWLCVCVRSSVLNWSKSSWQHSRSWVWSKDFFFLMIRTFYYYRLATDDNRRLEIIVPSEVYAASMYLSIKKKKWNLSLHGL